MSYSGLNYEYQVSVLLSVPCSHLINYSSDKYDYDHVSQWYASVLTMGHFEFLIQATVCRSNTPRIDTLVAIGSTIIHVATD